MKFSVSNKKIESFSNQRATSVLYHSTCLAKLMNGYACNERIGVKIMKSRDTLVRLKKFQVEEKRRRIVQLNAMITEFTRLANELDREITTEETRANITDPNHFAYPTYARAARGRRDNMVASINDLKAQLEEAETLFQEANEEFLKAQNQEARDRGAERMVDIVAERQMTDTAQIYGRNG